MSPTLVALCYHDVIGANGESSGMQSPGAAHYKLAHGTFAAHLDALAKAGVSPTVPGVDGTIGSDGAVMLTFDDGGISAISVIAPMLEERGWRGAFFLTSDWIGRDGFLASSDIAELERRGHVIGSHSKTHPPRISSLTPEEIAAEWTESARVLGGLMAAPVVTASVPGGFYSHDVGAAAVRAGCRLLFTSEPVVATQELDGCVVAGRFRVVATTSATSIADLAQGRGLARARQRLAWEAKKAAKRAGGSLWFRLRDRLRPA